MKTKIKHKYKSYEEMIAIALFNFILNNTHKKFLKDGAIPVPKNFIKYLSEDKGGDCTIHSMALKILSEKAGLKTRRWILNSGKIIDRYKLSHKVLEVYYNGGWHVFDPDARIRFKESVEELCRNPKKLEVYKKLGKPYSYYIYTYTSKEPKVYVYDPKIGRYLQKSKVKKLEKFINLFKKVI